jgi:hypothetical protein
VVPLRNYYERRFEQMAVQGNYVAAAIDFVGLQIALPEDNGDLGMEVALVFIPSGRILRGKGAVLEAAKRLGISPKKAKLAVERAKKAMGRRGDENVWIDAKSGDIVSPETGEVVGNIGDY